MNDIKHDDCWFIFFSLAGASSANITTNYETKPGDEQSWRHDTLFKMLTRHADHQTDADWAKDKYKYYIFVCKVHTIGSD